VKGITSTRTSGAAQKYRTPLVLSAGGCTARERSLHNLFSCAPPRGPHAAISPDHCARTQEPVDPNHLPLSARRPMVTPPTVAVGGCGRWVPLQHVQHPSTFATSRSNTCNIHLEQLKHLQHTFETLAKD
jgi:hypothetical protein